MAIPASGAISMSMLATEFSASQTTNMSLLGFGGELSTPRTSDIALAASFYGQSGVTLSSFGNFEAPGGGGFEDAGTACETAAEGVAVTRYHTGTGTTPVNGDKVYETNSTSNPLDDGYYAFTAGKNNFSYEIINGNGTVSDRTGCE